MLKCAEPYFITRYLNKHWHAFFTAIYHCRLFTDSEIQEIRKTRFSDVMRSVFGSHIADGDSFLVVDGKCELSVS